MTHGEEKDEHVWLSLKNAKTLVAAIADALQELDPDNKEYLRRQRLRLTSKSFPRWMARTSLPWTARRARPFCSATVSPSAIWWMTTVCATMPPLRAAPPKREASFETVSFLAKKVDELGLPCVLTIEGKNHKLAETIVRRTPPGRTRRC